MIDEPHRGAIGDMRWFQQPGIETIRDLINGNLPGPPPSRLTGSRPTDVGPGRVTFSMPVSRWLENSVGLIGAGIYALFADAPVASAIWSALPAGKVSTTSELNMSFLRPATRATEHLVGFAEAVHVGRQVGLASLRITDQNGRIMAHATTRCLIADVPVDFEADYPEPDTGPTNPSDPYLREPPGDDLYWPSEWLMTLTPIEAMENKDETRVFNGPIGWLTGFKALDFGDGEASGTMPSSAWFSNGGPAIYGGVLAWMASHAMDGAAYSLLDVGGLHAPLDLNVRYVRPGLINSGDLTAQARVIHRGRRLRVVEAQIRSGDGKPLVYATSSMLAVPDGAFELIRGKPADEIVKDP